MAVLVRVAVSGEMGALWLIGGGFGTKGQPHVATWHARALFFGYSMCVNAQFELQQKLCNSNVCRVAMVRASYRCRAVLELSAFSTHWLHAGPGIGGGAVHQACMAASVFGSWCRTKVCTSSLKQGVNYFGQVWQRELAATPLD